MSKQVKAYPTIGCCGIDCGLCPRYYTAGASKCPGCGGPDFSNKHPTCGYVTCCTKKKGLEVCAQCGEFSCSRFEHWLTDEGEYDSFVTHRRAYSNLLVIKEHGIEEFSKQQKERITLLERMLKDFDDGRSKSFFCLAAALLTIRSLKASLEGAEQKVGTDEMGADSVKVRSGLLKEVLSRFAAEEGVELRLRKKVR